MQTEYRERMTVAFNGMLADASGSPKEIKTFINASEDIQYGRGVADGGSADTCQLPTLITSRILGVTVAVHDNEDGGYRQGSALSVLGRGRIYVDVEEAVLPGDPVYVRYAGKPQIQTLVASADFVTGNTITGEVNGVAISVPFNTSNTQTLADLDTAIGLVAGVAGVANDTTRTCTITGDPNTEVQLNNFLVTGGASQPTFTITQTQALIDSSQRGRFRNDADSSTCLLIPNSAWVTGAEDGVAVLSLNLP